MTTKSHPADAGLSQASQNDQPTYELGFHLTPRIAEDEVAAVAEKVKTLLGEVEILAEGAPQKMTLAYTIDLANQGKHEKYTESYFGFIRFGVEREQVKGIEAKLRAFPQIIRFLLIAVDRNEPVVAPRRAVFASSRLEGETIKKPEPAVPEEKAEVSEEELDKSIDALVAE